MCIIKGVRKVAISLGRYDEPHEYDQSARAVECIGARSLRVQRFRWADSAGRLLDAWSRDTLGLRKAKVADDDLGMPGAWLVGDAGIVGVTCLDSCDLAMTAAEQGADYVAFGAFYPTVTKASQGRPSPQILSNWSLFTTVPCVAIGGITPSNCAPLVQSGADFLAVVAAVWDHPAGPGAAVKAFNEAIKRATE